MQSKEFEFDVSERHIICHYERFESPNEMYQIYKGLPLIDGKLNLRHLDYFDTERDIRPKKPGWAGFSSSESLWDRFLGGIRNDELTADAVKYATNAKVSRRDRLQDIGRNVYGGAVVVPAVLSGDPRNMWCIKRKKVKSRIIPLVIDVALTCNYTSAQYERVGQAVVRTIAKLEKAGYRVGVDVCISIYDDLHENSDGRHIIAMSYPAKRPNEVMNFRKILYPLTDTSFFRGVGFGWMVRNRNMSNDPCLGTNTKNAFGFDPEDRDEGIDKLYKGMFGNNVIMVRSYDLANRYTLEDAERFLEAQLLDVEE